MIFSVTDQREELLAIDERRRQIAADAAQPPAPAVTGLMSGTGTPAAGAVPMTAKAAEPDIAKRKKGKGRDRAGRDMTPGETAHAAVGDGYRAAMAEQDAAKASEIVTEGPGHGMMPSAPGPADSFSRPYLDAGHGAPSPQSEPPRTNPMPDLAPGIVTPVTLPAAPSAMNVPQHVSQQYCGGSPSEK